MLRSNSNSNPLILKLAWRNILRNKKRSLIQVTSVLFAVVFASFMRSIQYGAYDKMISNLVTFSTGYLQIQNVEYPENRTMDYALELSNFESLELPKNVTIEPRIESGALCSNGDISKPLAVLGIDPKGNMAKNLFTQGDAASLNKSNNIWLGQEMQRSLNIEKNDTVWLLGQGAYGSLAADFFLVGGFLDFKIPELNKRAGLMAIENAQDFFYIPDGATSLIVNTTKKKVPKTFASLQNQIDTNEYALLMWEEMLPEINQLITVDKAGGTFVLIILYGIIAFTLLGTVIMLTEERSREFAVMVAIGMSKKLLAFVSFIEGVILVLLGAISGILFAIPIVWFFKVNPIRLTGEIREIIERFGFEAVLPTALNFGVLFQQVVLVLLIVSTVNFYTLYKIKKLKPITELKR